MKYLKKYIETFCICIFLSPAIAYVPLNSGRLEDENNIREPPLAQTNSGPVQGYVTKTEDGKDVNVFLGIPYAAPPVGELRFQRPRKVEPWTIALQADRPLPACYQLLPDVKEIQLGYLRPWSEDCLHLNIWTQSPKPDKAPVMFFIHGGGFYFGSGLVDGSNLASEGLVVVSINYRLGPFGFLNLGTSDAPGNMGLMDQNLALQWTKENAEAFGGDPDKITLMGMSAGSASVGYHLLSPKSSGLFRAAIMMSGVPTNIWASMETDRSLEKSKTLVNSLGCHSLDSSETARCLRQRHPEDIIEQSKSPFMELTNKFVPTIDGDFITEHPAISVASGRFHPVDVMIGTTIDEGFIFMMVNHPDLLDNKDGRLFRRDFSKVIRSTYPSLTSLQADALDISYTNWVNPEDPYLLRDAAKDMYSDSTMCCHVNDFAEKLVQAGNNVYRYVYDYKIPTPGIPDWSGAIHSQDELPIMAVNVFLKQLGITLKEDIVGHRFRKHFVNFAFSGNPNLDKKKFPGETDWPKFDSRKLHLNFGANSTIRAESRIRECALWLHLLPLLDQKDTC